MVKYEELTNPSSCLNKAKEHERIFVLLERDVATPDTIRFWVRRRIAIGKNKPSDPQIQEALEAARKIEETQNGSL